MQSSEIYTSKDAFHYFFSENIIEEILSCTILQGIPASTQGNAVQKEQFLGFYWVGDRVRIRVGHTKISLGTETKS